MKRQIAIVSKSPKILRTISRNAPGIALVYGGVGMLGAVVTSSVAAIKSVRLIDAEEKKRGEKLTTKEKVQLCWKNYILTTLLTLTSEASLIFSGKKYAANLKQASLLYAASEAARQSLEENVIKRFGEKKFNDLQDDVAAQYAEKHPITERTEIIDTHKGTTLCLDTLSGRYFYCDIQTIKAGLNAANAMLLDNDYISYNMLWECISSEFEDIGFGEDVGWNIMDKRTNERNLIKLTYTYRADENGNPKLIIGYRNRPQLGYDRY